MIWVFEVIDKVLERLPLIKHYDIKIHTNTKFNAKLEKHQKYDDGLVISSQLKFNSLDLKSNVVFLIEKGTDGNVHYYFGIKNSIDFKSDNDDDIMKSIHDIALRSYADNALSFEHIVSLKNNAETFPEDEFEYIVKEMNKRMFYFDEYGQKYDLPLFESKKEKELSLLITEMKKIGVEKLPYAYASLKPFIDAETMKIHYTKHYKGYVDKLNKALSNKKGDYDLKEIVKSINKYSKEIRNNAGGAFNHALFWNMLSPKKQEIPKELKEKITKDFGSIQNFKNEFEKKAKQRFGSGWVWLIVTSANKLKIMTTPNQDNPLMNIIKHGGNPILGLDLWEHSYYLKYENKRDEYIHNFWNNVNWEYVFKLFKENNMKKRDILAILKEDIGFDNWKMPSLEQLKLEYYVEHELKGNYFFESEEDFLNAVEEGEVETITKKDDYNIGYRSHTSSKESLLNLIRSYRSYPQFRNEKTVEAIYDGFKENKPMDLPIVIEFNNGRRRVFCGNTRMDIAFQLGIDPKVLVIKSSVR